MVLAEVPVAEASLGFLVAGGLGGMCGAASTLPGGSGARRMGWRGVKVSWLRLGREDAEPNKKMSELQDKHCCYVRVQE